MPVRPLPWLQLDRDHLAVAAVDRVLGKAQARVQLHLAVVAEPVQRPVHEELELAEVGHAEVAARGQREDVVGLGVRLLGKGGGPAGQSRGV